MQKKKCSISPLSNDFRLTLQRAAIVSLLEKIKNGSSTKFTKDLQAKHTWKKAVALTTAFVTELCQTLPPAAIATVGPPCT